MLCLGLGKMDENKVLIAVICRSNILNSFRWPRRGEEQDVTNQINNKTSKVNSAKMLDIKLQYRYST